METTEATATAMARKRNIAAAGARSPEFQGSSSDIPNVVQNPPKPRRKKNVAEKPPKPKKIQAKVKKDPVVKKPRKPRQSTKKKVYDQEGANHPSNLSRATIADLCRKFGKLSFREMPSRRRKRGRPVVPNNEKQIMPFDGKNKALAKAKVNLELEDLNMFKWLMGLKVKKNYIPDSDYWQRERVLMQARAEDFIARMHLIQGDRRFSKWSSSMLDSIVGAFLTQNVSDVLSSSAFMHLAATFPCKRGDNAVVTSNGNTTSVYETSTPGRLAQENDKSVQYNPSGEEREIYNEPSRGIRKNLFNDRSESFKAAEPDFTDELLDMHTRSEGNLMETDYEFGNTTPPLENRKPAGFNPSREERETYGDSSSRQAKRSLFKAMEAECSNNSRPEIDLNTTGLDTEEDFGLLFGDESFTGGPKPLTRLVVEAEQQNTNVKAAAGNENASVQVEGSYTELLHHGPKSPEAVGDDERILISEEPPRPPPPPKKVKTYARKRRKINQEDTPGMQQDLDPEEEERKRKAAIQNAIRKATEERARREFRKQLRARVMEKYPDIQSDEPCVDWYAVKDAPKSKIASAIAERGMQHMLSERIKVFLKRLFEEQGILDLEWLRHVSPAEAKEYLLGVHGLGLKSVECIRLLEMELVAFPVDVNVARICTRLGWVPIEPLAEQLELHLLSSYPVQANVQKYLWPRLCHLEQRFLYELHYQLITFGKVFCAKTKPNCNECPMQNDCKHFASKYNNSKLPLPDAPSTPPPTGGTFSSPTPKECVPVVEEPESPRASSAGCSFACRKQCFQCGKEPSTPSTPSVEVPGTPERLDEELPDIEDLPCGRKTGLEAKRARTNIKVWKAGERAALGMEDTPAVSEDSQMHIVEYTDTEAAPSSADSSVQDEDHLDLRKLEQEEEARLEAASKALVAFVGSRPRPALKMVARLRTIHNVYQLPDGHELLMKYKMEQRLKDDPCFYTLAILNRSSYDSKDLHPDTEKGIFLIPCRTATRGNFPLNGTYFQVNEVFADYYSSENPIDVPRELIWNLRTRSVHCGTSTSTIFRGLFLQEIQRCFWTGYICVRAFDRGSRRPMLLSNDFHRTTRKQRKADLAEDAD